MSQNALSEYAHVVIFAISKQAIMHLKIFATVHSLTNDIDLFYTASLARAICFEHRIHSPGVILVL